MRLCACAPIHFPLTKKSNPMKGTFSVLSLLLAWMTWNPFSSAQVCDNLCLALDGNGDYISLNTTTTPVTGNASFTAETWFYANSTGSIARLLCMSGNATPSTLEVGLLGSGALFIYWRNTPGNGGTPLPVFITTTPANLTGAWHHLALTRSGGSLQVYLNGTSVYTVSSAVGPFFFDEFLVGHSNVFPGDDWEGQVDEIRLWNTVRTTQQIKDYKDCSLSGTSTGLVANWPLNFEGANPGGVNNFITHTLDAAIIPTIDNGVLHGFDLANANTISNFVCNLCPPPYQLNITDLPFQNTLLISACVGDPVHFCVKDAANNSISVPVGTTVEWQSSENNAAFTTDADLLNYSLAHNALCFPVKKNILKNLDCGNAGNGFTDRTYRAKIVKTMGAEMCTYTSSEQLLRLCCRPDCGTITLQPSIPGPWCEGDNVLLGATLNPCDPWVATGSNVQIDWYLIDGSSATILPFQNQLSFSGWPFVVGTTDICLQAVISNCSCPALVVEKCVSVDPMPVCGTIDIVPNPPAPISPAPPAGPPYQYTICPGGYSIVEMVNAAQFQNCNPVWQYHFDVPVGDPWKDLGTSNSQQNTNTLPLLNPPNPPNPAIWPAGATRIYYRIECRPESWPNSGCDPCYSNEVEVALEPPPPSGVISGPTQFCVGSNVTLSVTPNVPGPWTYCWYLNGILQQCFNDPINTYTTNKPGCYWVDISNNCESKRVGPHCIEQCVPVPVVKCPEDNPCACAGQPITLDGCDSYDTCPGTTLTYTWSWDSGTLVSVNGCILVHIPDSNGTTYTLTVTNSLNPACSTTSKPLFIKPCQ